MAAHRFDLVARWLAALGLAAYLILIRPTAVRAASLYLDPAAGSYVSGQTFTATVKIDTVGEAINAVGGTVNYPADLLRLTKISRAGSIVQYWTVEPEKVQSDGQVEFAGGLPTPGYNGGAGLVLAITWQVLATGQANVIITQGGIVANDGQGTLVLGSGSADVVSSQGTAQYTLIGPAIAPPSQTPDQAPLSDQTPPAPFVISLRRDRGDNDPTPEAVFYATDDRGPIARYTISLDGQPVGPAVSPVQLEVNTAGEHEVVVTAYDGAGNARQSSTKFIYHGHPPPTITAVTANLLLLEPLVVKGRANAGDTVMVYIDGQPVGQVQVSNLPTTEANLTVRLPWTWTSETLFRPGRHTLTAMSVPADGPASVATDSIQFNISGRHFSFGGRTLGTVAMAPLAGSLFLAILTTIIVVMTKLVWSVINLHRREALVENEVLNLQAQLHRGSLTPADVDRDLSTIAADLQPPRKKRASRRPNRQR